MSQSGSSLAPFKNQQFLAFWLTGLSSNFGWLIQLVGASWLMTSIDGTPQMVALVQTSLALPVMLFSLVAGAMADSFGRRTIVIWSQTFLLVVSILLAASAYFGFINPWMLLTFTFLIGTGKAVNNPGWQTLVSEYMPREDLPAAIMLNSVGFNIARTVGPAVGGVIVAIVGAFAAFVISAVSNVGMIVALLRWHSPTPTSELPPEPLGAAMMAGLRYAAMSPNILLVTVRGTIFNVGAVSVMALMPLIARDSVAGGADFYGVLLGAFGVGAVCVSFTGSWLRRRLSLEAVARIGFAIFALATAVMALSPYAVIVVLGSAMAGAAWIQTLATFNTVIQMSSPRWVVSRCHAIYQTGCFAGSALGSLLWGYLAGQIGTGGALLASGVVLLVGALMGVWLKLTELDTMGVDPQVNWKTPNFASDLLPHSGPILTTIEYIIREEDVPQFLAIMSERRRSRTRNGARRWNLSRDIREPELWTERYHIPTWVETVRYHLRRTKTDAEWAKRAHDLHRGDERPKIRHHLDERHVKIQFHWSED